MRQAARDLASNLTSNIFHAESADIAERHM